uniref:NADH-ubiquinone oxidoreductase chain 1 n=1 Tax=Atrina pectinata TaxID=49198 RepID=L0EUD0_ATRPE|nr:NADH dehydrogenase subunit 1 [Atrina pectinata]AGA63955.1 NADH dehydrogenase subunit 1 [Atrina pectinata]UZT27166.1 NADH dehydrogenase subunit 1 [Atrina pectinata]
MAYSLEVISVYLCVFLAVAFFTLFERKALASYHLRKGPNKVGFGGFPQPLADALKLFTKELPVPHAGLSWLFYACPGLALLVMLLLWWMYPVSYGISESFMGVLFFLCVSSLNAYVLMFAGWSSNSKYAGLGSIRAFAQTISYEVSMSLILLFMVVLHGSFSLALIQKSGGMFWYGLIWWPITLSWLISCLAETNRTPFDFVEAESELVSGYNVEYGGGGFAALFIAEYGNIIFISFFTISIFFGSYSSNSYFLSQVSLLLKTMLVCYWFIWVRASFPRLRYDLLMELMWKSVLPGCLMSWMGLVLYGLI